MLLLVVLMGVGGSLRFSQFLDTMSWARIFTKVEDVGVWPDGLLDDCIAMIPKSDGDATPLGQRPLSVLPIVFRIWASARMGQLEDWFKSWVPASVFSAGGGRGSVEAWYTSALDIEEVLTGATDSDVHLFVADVVKFFDTVDRSVLDRVLSSLGLPGWFRHAYFEYHAHVRMRFNLASGLGEPWTPDGGIPQGCPLSMMFIVALYLPSCRYLAAQVGVQPQLYADNLKCVSRDPGLLLSAARFTTGHVGVVVGGHVDAGGEVSSCRGFCSVPGPLQSVQRAEMWGVILASLSSGAIHLGVDNLGVVRHVGRLLDGHCSSVPFELIKDGDLLLLLERMLHLRGSGTVRITKVKGHADEVWFSMVEFGRLTGLVMTLLIRLLTLVVAELVMLSLMLVVICPGSVVAGTL